MITFEDFFFGMKSTLNEHQLINFSMVIYSIWYRRKFKLWENKDEPVRSIIVCVHIDWDVWSRVNSFKNNLHRLDPVSTTHANIPFSVCAYLKKKKPFSVWTKPPFGLVKCNIDAGFNGGGGGGGVGLGNGICVRRPLGEFLMARTFWKNS